MEIESAKCECCGLKEDCTQDYITDVKSKFGGKWLCGLCSEAVRDEVMSGGKKAWDMDEAVKAHMSFCRKFKSNPAVRVAEGMRQMLRRRSISIESSPSSSSSTSSSPSSKKYSRSTSTSQVGDSSTFSLY
ncbi:unnamed protein product [Trifolium pratense]|uniref:Uncharacterized protein n=1 Tax=Trifolium pratense TaxID=57577 RepID=A0ACB0IE15_TRIPR|nr:unnamed protein product [Trifolium pratense]